VVDSSDKMRLEDTKSELHSLLKQERLIGATLLIFCNKQDIPDSLTCNQIKEYIELEAISTRHWGIIGCSARTGEGLLEGIDWIVKDIAGRLFTYL
jgi:ADP-ribosylation factor-like protein 2